MNAFEVLGIEERLVISEEEVRAAFREAGKKVHPDAGGADGEFAALKEALGILSSPSRRLRHWLLLRGIEVETRGTIGGELMDLFGEVGGVTQRAEAVIRKREEAKSALAKALLENETQASREDVESAISKVDAVIAKACLDFPAMEISGKADAGAVAQVVRDLAFLEKWMAGLRSCYSRLV
jgi:curved DNA-binding protein CbpA